MTPTHKKRIKIELLAPARNVEIGIEAIKHGADAIYIGGPSFGARSAANNSVEDIQRLCNFAHLYGVRVYVTLNTILWDSELKAAENLIWELYKIGVDALIVQDLSLLKMKLPPIALHASTQMDNCSVDKAKWLEAAGFKQIVLARETSLEQTQQIAAATKVPLEAFVHGALCVSYSGRCYASQYCFNRSANRGCCAQFCRLAFDLVDEKGNTLIHNRHLLSLKDMNRTSQLEEMMDAGVRSFKIEGRLKDATYVKNVTAWYRQQIDKILNKRADVYERSSFGTSHLNFVPDVNRTFNRNYTEYFLHGRTENPIQCFTTPKAIGPQIGKVGRIDRQYFEFIPLQNAAAPLTAGDGLCFINNEGILQGFRVNKIEGNRVYPAKMPTLMRNTKLHRNQDFAFEKKLAKETAQRQLKAEITLREVEGGYVIDIIDESGTHASLRFDYEHTLARTPQQDAITRQLSKLGDTPFEAVQVNIELTQNLFIPASILTNWRRQVCDLLLNTHLTAYERDRSQQPNDEQLRQLLPHQLTYTANVANHLAKEFYKEHGVEQIADAFEIEQPSGKVPIMTCRYCLRHALGCCLKKTKGDSRQLSLRLPDGRTFPLKFDCKKCEMQVLKSK